MKMTGLLAFLLVSALPTQARTLNETQDTAVVATDEASMSEWEDTSSEEDELKVRVKGFLDTYHAVSTEGDNDWMASRTRVRGEMTVDKGAASMFVSLNATYNGKLKERTGIELREAYLSWKKGGLDLRAGRQIVVWGVADALRITDCVSPCDYTEFLAQDYDDIRMPVNVLRAKYSWTAVTLEALCCPMPDFFMLPTDAENPWSVKLPSLTMPYDLDLESGKPRKRIGNAEFGGRMGVTLRGIDFSLYALHTWNKMPVLAMRLSEDGQELHLDGQYRRMTMVGADCAIPAGQLVIRGEAACYLNEAQGTATGTDVKQRDAFNALIGLDWYPGNDWNVSIQYSHKHIAGSHEGIAAFRNSGLTTARISKELLQNTLKMSTFAYIDVANGGIFNRFSTSYALNDQIELTAGYDYFHADAGQFAMYAKNSEAWVKLKYSF